MPNILVVEDDTSLRETLVYNLKRQEYDVEAVGDGLTALKVARLNHPDLVLLDLMLPGLDGSASIFSLSQCTCTSTVRVPTANSHPHTCSSRNWRESACRLWTTLVRD